MRKLLISLIFHGLIMISLILIVFASTVRLDSSEFTMNVPLLPIILFLLLCVTNYFVFKKMGISTKNIPNIIHSDDEREMHIMNETALFAFHTLTPIITGIGFVVIILTFGVDFVHGLNSRASLFRTVGTVMVLVMGLPSLIQTILVIIKVNRV